MSVFQRDVSGDVAKQAYGADNLLIFISDGGDMRFDGNSLAIFVPDESFASTRHSGLQHNLDAVGAFVGSTWYINNFALVLFSRLLCCGLRTLAGLIQESDPQTSINMLLKDETTASNPVTQLLAARLCHEVGRLRDAEEIYDKLLADRPDDPIVWLETGKLADATGADSLATSRLKRAVALTDKGKDVALAALALSHMHAGRLKEAGNCWWRAARCGPDSPNAWAGLLVCAFACDRTTLADRAGRMLDRHWSKSECRAAIADLWPHAAGAIVIRQNTPDHAHLTIQADSPLNDLLAGAVQTLKSQAQSKPERADTHYHLAACCEALEDVEAASRSIRAALQINPTYAAAADLAKRLQAA